MGNHRMPPPPRRHDRARGPLLVASLTTATFGWVWAAKAVGHSGTHPQTATQTVTSGWPTVGLDVATLEPVETTTIATESSLPTIKRRIITVVPPVITQRPSPTTAAATATLAPTTPAVTTTAPAATTTAATTTTDPTTTAPVTTTAPTTDTTTATAEVTATLEATP